MLGVTGTKGKSTTLELINAILEAAGKKTALVSSIRVKVGDDVEKNSTSMTMPGRLFLQRFLRRAVNEKCEYALIEATSQGVLQYRHRCIDFNAVMVTNIHPEHIEAHGSFENYRDAKCQFFRDAHRSVKSPKYFFVNEQMRDRECFERVANGTGTLIYFSREDFIHNELASRYGLETENAKKLVSQWLQNDFNLENVAAAVAFAKSQGILWDIIFKTLETFGGVPGRMEVVQKEPFMVVVDYAHTSDSLEAVYVALRSFGAAQDKQALGVNRLIAVLGAAGGGRDKWKRAEMGRIAARHVAHIILTNEDPYDEDPNEILSQIEGGIVAEKEAGAMAEYEKILDRRVAIGRAIALAKVGDVVILTGKGSEPWIHYEHGRKEAWSERGVADEALKIRD